MRFSVAGLLILAVIFTPNLLFMVFPPRHIPEDPASDGVLFTICERIGQAGCILLLLFCGADLKNNPPDSWFALMAVCILIYEALWVRYFLRGREFALLFNPLWGIPVPMAVFPVLAFGFAAMWARSLWLGIAAAVLAVGHLANSWNTYLGLSRNAEKAP